MSIISIRRKKKQMEIHVSRSARSSQFGRVRKWKEIVNGLVNCLKIVETLLHIL